MQITKEIASKVLETVDAGLVKGMGQPVPGQMCVEAAVCFAMGLPHSDAPSCVSPAIRALKIRLNDSEWSSDEARAKGMRRLALVQLGSAGAVDDNAFARRIAEMTVRKIVPIALRAAASIHPEQKHKNALETSAVNCETFKDSAADSAAESAAYSARSAAYSAAYSAYSAADSAAESAAYSADSAADSARSAAYSADSAAYSADSAADSAAESAAYSARSAAYSAADSADSARDQVLGAFAEEVVQVLVEMKAPGCEWLELAPLS